MQLRTVWSWLAVAACATACESASAPPASAPPAPAAPSAGVTRGEAVAPGEKPSAPVAVTLVARAVGGDDYELTLTATPSVDVPALELMLDGRTVAAGATSAGQVRTLRVHVHADGGLGRDVAGGAAVGTGNHRRTRGAVAHVGAQAAAAPQRVQIITMPDGSEVAEVRP
ncbi:MAG: hypothetical protein H6709_09615 [Kofleriaceae bacterium]|nr:hypothetical protein [Kofleriaceae bacterium]